MRDCNSITKETKTKLNRETHYGTMLRVGPSSDAIVVFRREPYHLTAAKREKETILNDYRERSQKNSR